MSDAHRLQPFFLITIDTEGDDAWSRRRPLTTRNAAHLRRFQLLCESFALKPTYLTNHEMALAPAFQELGRDVLSRRTAEIGMHLHAWNSPPLYPLTSDDAVHHPYLVEYPVDVMRRKTEYMTDLLEQTFQVKVTSHRAGRWSFNEAYARLLLEQGYLVDCSVTPRVSWKALLGDPNQSGGADYTGFPDSPYMVDLDRIDRPGVSPLMEAPATVLSFGNCGVRRLRACFREGSVPRRALNRLWPERAWLRPNGKNLVTMLRILTRAVAEGRDCVEFMLHSSELTPGASPTFPDASSIEVLYRHLERLFAAARKVFRGATLTEYYWDAYPRLVPLPASMVASSR
jgi:hypothetical protein